MLNRILIFGWLAVAAILVIENMVISGSAFIFMFSGYAWQLSIVSIVIWFFIWYWVKSFFTTDSWDEENYDF